MIVIIVTFIRALFGIDERLSVDSHLITFSLHEFLIRKEFTNLSIADVQVALFRHGKSHALSKDFPIQIAFVLMIF